ncbi:hypothetical protein RFI_37867 [Reticulomyxa filosa]|uniref:Uncharacterized protein n=1 Tax=Reticulomyxa filosa TaxID=46433 RepID=X6LDH3_RETFI|nr:hypothetical protein RFI_37867 [Reticulomyxa filosa]|eukprot:ETN99603.1 hypothetical protein RFI_37867 [Reticulomyxa filosa]
MANASAKHVIRIKRVILLMSEQRTNNCWDECIGNNFLNTGDTDQDPVICWAFFEEKVFHNMSLIGQPLEAHRFFKSDNMDLLRLNVGESCMLLVVVSQETVYSYITGQLISLGSAKVPSIYGCWFRKWTNPRGNRLELEDGVNKKVTPFTSTVAPTIKSLPILNFTGAHCQTGNMDLFVIVDDNHQSNHWQNIRSCTIISHLSNL